MDTNCAPLVSDLFLFSYESECMISLLMIGMLILLTLLTLRTSRYLDDILKNMVSQIYSSEL